MISLLSASFLGAAYAKFFDRGFTPRSFLLTGEVGGAGVEGVDLLVVVRDYCFQLLALGLAALNSGVVSFSEGVGLGYELGIFRLKTLRFCLD